MANYVSIQRKIDRGRGIAGRVLGPPWDVYRVGINAATDFLDEVNRVRKKIRIMRRRISAKDNIEAPERFGALFFEILGDMTKFLTGDVFVEVDPVYGVGGDDVNYPTQQINGFCLAFHSPIKKSIGARIDRLATIWRPSQEPDSTGFWDPTLPNAKPLQFVAGQTIFGDIGGIGSKVPIGLQSTPITRTEHFQDVPHDAGTSHWYCYVPPLPNYVDSSENFTIKENDRIVAEDGSRYVVRHPYRQDVGFVGHTLVVERELEQT